jgi:hypothetical protein
MLERRAETMNDQTNRVRDYEFALLLGGIPELTTDVEDALFKAGCDDATLSIQYGAARLEFTRSAASMKVAILSAIGDVYRSGLNVSVLLVDECNLVNQSEIADRIGRTRQLVSKYISGGRGPGGFPPPVCHIGDMPLWRWCEVMFWLSENDMVRPEELEEAEAVAAINTALEWFHQECRNPVLLRDVSQFIENAAKCGCE